MLLSFSSWFSKSWGLTDISCFGLIYKFSYCIIILSLVWLINNWSKHYFFWMGPSSILLLILYYLILLNYISSKTKIIIFCSLRSRLCFVTKINRKLIFFISLIFIIFIKLNILLNILFSFLQKFLLKTIDFKCWTLNALLLLLILNILLIWLSLNTFAILCPPIVGFRSLDWNSLLKLVLLLFDF